MAIGKEVARVAVRVIPDTSRFARDLERQLKKIEKTTEIKIPVRLDESKIDEDLGRLEKNLAKATEGGITVPVRIGDPQGGVKAPKVDPIKVPVEPEPRGFRERLQAFINSFRGTRIKVPVDVDEPSIRKSSGALRNFFSSAKAGAGATIPIFGRLGRAFTRILGPISSASGFMGKFGAIAGTAGGAIAGLALKILSMVPIASAAAAGIGLLAGAVLAVGGAATAGLGGLPVLLTAIGAPIAALALGMDGIKRAAASLSEPFNQLKTSVSAAFEQGLTPVFERLKVVFPVLERGMVGIAGGLSRFASGLTDVVTTSAGLSNIERALAGSQRVIDLIIPGSRALLTQLLEIAGTSQLYDILGNSINNALGGIAKFLERLRPELVPALTQLDLVLRSAGRALGELLLGATEFFTAAGPGLTQFFDGLQVAFSNIDWTSLGDSFGRIFGAIGKGLRDVPPETWARLATAVSGFADAIEAMVASGAIDSLIGLFIRLVEAAGFLVRAVTAAGHGISGVLAVLRGDFAAADLSFQKSWTAMQTKTEESGAAIAQSTATHSNNAANSFNQNISRMPQDAANHGRSATAGLANSLAPMPGQAGRAGNDTSNLLNQGLRRAEPEARSTGTGIMAGLRSGLESGRSSVISSAVRVALAAFNAAKAALGIGSPSKEFIWVGEMVVQGFTRAMERGQQEAARAGQNLATASIPDAVNSILRSVDLSGWYRLGQSFVTEISRGMDSEKSISAEMDERLKTGTGWKRAEDGTLVRPGFYPEDRGPKADMQNQIYQAVYDALHGAELRVDGRGVARLVNDSNLRDRSR